MDGFDSLLLVQDGYIMRKGIKRRAIHKDECETSKGSTIHPSQLCELSDEFTYEHARQLACEQV